MSRKITVLTNFTKITKFNTKINYECSNLNIFSRHFSILNTSLNQLNIYTENKNTKATIRIPKLTFTHTRSHHECVTNLKCWKCDKDINTDTEQFMCTCGVIQAPVPNRSYFQVFSMAETFDVDLRKLKQGHQQLQTLLHPDKCASKSEKERSFADEHSSTINEAYKTLQQPLTRGLYMLDISPSDNTLESEIDIDNEFLASMMELNESISESHDEEALLKIEKDNNNEMEGLVVEISKGFSRGELAKAKECLLKMKYLNSASDRIKEIKRENHYSD